MTDYNDSPVTFTKDLVGESGMLLRTGTTWLSIHGDISRCKHGLARHQTCISIERVRGTRDTGNPGAFHVISIVFQHRSARIWKDGKLALFMGSKDCLKQPGRRGPTSDKRQGVQFEILLRP